MKELLSSIAKTYEDCRGTGKFFALFFVAVLIIYLINNSASLMMSEEETGTDRRVSPGLFLLAPVACIGYAFALLYNRMRCVVKGSRVFCVLMSTFTVLALMLGGTRVFKAEDHYVAENKLHIKQAYVEVMDTMLNGTEGTLRVMASPDISSYMALYDPRFDMMYGYPENGDVSSFKGDIRYVYEQMSVPTPEETQVVEKTRALGYDYIVYNADRTYMEMPLEEYDYELVAEVAGYRIYKDSKDSAVNGSIKSNGLVRVILISLAGIVLLVMGAVGLIGKRSAKGRKDPLLFAVVALIALQVLGTVLFACENPAALPCGISGKTAVTLVYFVMPFIMIPAYYCMYMLLAKELFREGSGAGFFMLCMCILNLWGYQSDALLPVTMLYGWFTWQSLLIHGLLPFALCIVLRKWDVIVSRLGAGAEEGQDDTGLDDESLDYYRWEEEDMKNHKIVNARTVAIALLVVVIMLIGSMYIMNRKINSLYNVTVDLQQQVEELKQEK